MRATMVLFTILGVAVLGRTAAAEDARLAASRDIASGMQAALKGELAQAMTTAGPVGAIAVCRTRAPAIAAQAGNAAGVRVSRTALRLRNPANAPDEQGRPCWNSSRNGFAPATHRGSWSISRPRPTAARVSWRRS